MEWVLWLCCFPKKEVKPQDHGETCPRSQGWKVVKTVVNPNSLVYTTVQTECDQSMEKHWILELELNFEVLYWTEKN